MTWIGKSPFAAARSTMNATDACSQPAQQSEPQRWPRRSKPVVDDLDNRPEIRRLLDSGRLPRPFAGRRGPPLAPSVLLASVAPRRFLPEGGVSAARVSERQTSVIARGVRPRVNVDVLGQWRVVH